MLLTRVLGQAKTWFPTFTSVFVYSDDFPNDTISDIQKEAPHANISFVEIKDKAEHIIGSQWANPWYRAQPRFLEGMYHLYTNNRHAKWFIIGDDDTYLLPWNIIRRLGKHNSTDPEVVSFFWCTWNQITDHMYPQRECHPFAQGGSGVLFSRKMMDLVGPHLRECNEMYNDAEHAASMRVCVCMERLFGYANWTKNGFIKPWKSGIHPIKPIEVLQSGNTWDAPGSFHQVNAAEMKHIQKAHYASTEEGFYDFSRFAFRTVAVELTRRRYWQLHFGYLFSNFGTLSNKLKSITSLIPNEDATEFKQFYEGGIELQIHCDKSIEPDEMIVDDVERSFNTTVHLLLNCPPLTIYYT